MRKTVFILLLLCAVAGCGRGKSNAASTGDTNVQTQTVNDSVRLAQKYTFPDVPSYLADPTAEAEYIVEHYWDGYDFNDEDYVLYPSITRSIFTGFVRFLDHVPAETTSSAIMKMMNGASENKAMLNFFLETAETVLYDPLSQYRNDEYYIPILRYAIESDKLEDVEKIRPRAHLEMAMKNRVGHKANDITYTTADGRTGRLYNIGTPYTILFINNPDCTACAMIIEQMRGSDIFNQLLSGGRLTILAVYPDKDLEAWRNHRSDIPENWIYSYDATQTMDTQRTYDLKAIPTLYLLDRNKNVIIKDADNAYPIAVYFAQQSDM